MMTRRESPDAARFEPPGALTQEPHEAGLTPVLARNIEALCRRRAREERTARWQDRVADRITAFTGSMSFVGLLHAGFGFWFVANLGWVPGIRPFDESFVVLAMIASVEAIFLSTFVLITQNRMTEQADERADLNLQISLLSEHEVTRLVVLVSAIARSLNLAEASDPEIEE